MMSRDSPGGDGLTWHEAADMCATHNAHLVSIGDKDEMAYIHYVMATVWYTMGSEAYIGEWGSEAYISEWVSEAYIIEWSTAWKNS
jgi:hypothetical protein